MRDPLSGPLRSHVLSGESGRGRMRVGALSLGLSPAGSKQPEQRPVIVVGR